MTAWLSVVGLGEDGPAGLSPAARALVDEAEVLVGAKRHLAMLPEHGAERLTWQFPLDPLMAALQARRGRRVVMLATGDPMCFGIGSTLARYLKAEEMTLLPGPSALTLACNRIGWPEHEVELLTLHGRPLELLNGWLCDGQKLVLLSHDGGTPTRVAALLCERGYGDSAITVLEHMGGTREARHDALAVDWGERKAADLNTIAVHCVAGPDAVSRPRVPGLPDEAFRHDGQLTKRDVRAATLAALAPLPGRLLWDVGAGSGAVAIEWLRAAPNTKAIAIERDAARRANVAANAAALGTPMLEVVSGDAPAALQGLAAPDAVFVGGGVAAPGVIEACWEALRPGGRLVANAVTLAGERALLEWHGRVGGELTRMAVSRAEPLGDGFAWRPLMPVTRWAVRKS